MELLVQEEVKQENDDRQRSAWDAYRYPTGTEDRRAFTKAYLGQLGESGGLRFKPA